MFIQIFFFFVSGLSPIIVSKGELFEFINRIALLLNRIVFLSWILRNPESKSSWILRNPECKSSWIPRNYGLKSLTSSCNS